VLTPSETGTLLFYDVNAARRAIAPGQPPTTRLCPVRVDQFFTTSCVEGGGEDGTQRTRQQKRKG
jgi:hypothetical protein